VHRSVLSRSTSVNTSNRTVPPQRDFAADLFPAAIAMPVTAAPLIGMVAACIAARLAGAGWLRPQLSWIVALWWIR
jgi:hypothetical protein